MMQSTMSLRRSAVAQRPFTSRCPSVRCTASFSTAKVLQAFEQDQMKPANKKLSPSIGDSVKMNVLVTEGKGKTRTQRLEGVIIATHGAGANKTVTFRRLFQGVGAELIVPVNSPIVDSMELVKKGKIRRSKLYFLRQLAGRAARLKEVVGSKKKDAAAAAKVAAKTAAAKEKEAAASA